MNTLSIIIPAYQAEGTIGRLLRSIIKLDLDSILEIIVINDGSTDRTAEIARQFALDDPRIKVVNQDNKGRSNARNCGIQLARGDWVMFADSDDYIIDGGSQSLQDALGSKSDLVIFPTIRSDRNGNIGYSQLVWGGQDIMGQNVLCSADTLRSYMIWHGIKRADDWPKELQYIQPYSVWARLYKRSHVEQLRDCRFGFSGPFPEGLRFSEDRVFNLLYLSLQGVNDVELSNRPLYYWDLGKSQTVSASPNASDVLEILPYIDIINCCHDGGVVATEEIEPIVARDLLDHFVRTASVYKGGCAEIVEAWNRLLENEDVTAAFSSIPYNNWKSRVQWQFPLTVLREGHVAGSIKLASTLQTIKRVFW